MDDDRLHRDLLKGRLAMALVCARAQKCPRKDCARQGRCLGRMPTRFHAPMGDCPNMSAAEWRAVSLGMQANLRLLRPSVEARRAQASSGLDRRSSAARPRTWNAAEVAAAGAEAARQAAAPGASYAELLWLEPGENGLTRPHDLAATGRKFVTWMGECGCACARGALAPMEACACWALGEVAEGGGGSRQ